MMAILDSARLKSGCDILRNDATVNRFSHRFDLLHHFGKGFGRERLLAIGDRMCGIGMHFDDDTIGTRSDTGFSSELDPLRNLGGRELPPAELGGVRVDPPPPPTRH